MFPLWTGTSSIGPRFGSNLVFVHCITQLTNVEKLAYMYLRHALKDGPAVQAIEGLSQLVDQYEQAIGCLKRRYGRPRPIH